MPALAIQYVGIYAEYQWSDIADNPTGTQGTMITDIGSDGNNAQPPD